MNRSASNALEYNTVFLYPDETEPSSDKVLFHQAIKMHGECDTPRAEKRNKLLVSEFGNAIDADAEIRSGNNF